MEWWASEFWSACGQLVYGCCSGLTRKQLLTYYLAVPTATDVYSTANDHAPINSDACADDGHACGHGHATCRSRVGSLITGPCPSSPLLERAGFAVGCKSCAASALRLTPAGRGTGRDAFAPSARGRARAYLRAPGRGAARDPSPVSSPAEDTSACKSRPAHTHRQG